MINENLVEAQNYARRTAQKMLRTYPDDVEDVLQDAAIKAIRGIHGFVVTRSSTHGLPPS